MHNPTLEEITEAGPWSPTVHFSAGTVGRWKNEYKMESLLRGVDIGGMTTLDIGCMTGVDSLYMRERGASRQLCIDNCSGGEPTEKQFELVKREFDLDIELQKISVFDLNPAEHSSDVVLFAGVYYHLQDPLRGLNCAWNCTKRVLLVEGGIILDMDGPYARFVIGEYDNDATNWWVPTMECLTDWCRSLDGNSLVRNITTDEYHVGRAMLQVWR